MFSWFKKKQTKSYEVETLEKNEISLQDEVIPVANLKQHIVDAYENERYLEEKIQVLEESLIASVDENNNLKNENEILKVTADELSKRTKSLEQKYEKETVIHKETLNHLSNTNTNLTDRVNTLKIKIKELNDEKQEDVISFKEAEELHLKTLKAFIDNLEKEIIGHKGNLSKKSAIKYLKEVALKHGYTRNG